MVSIKSYERSFVNRAVTASDLGSTDPAEERSLRNTRIVRTGEASAGSSGGPPAGLAAAPATAAAASNQGVTQ
jgi:hypothetical protein